MSTCIFAQQDLDKVTSILVANQCHPIEPGSLRLQAGSPNEELQNCGAPGDPRHKETWHVFTAKTADSVELNCAVRGAHIIGHLDELQAVAVKG